MIHFLSADPAEIKEHFPSFIENNKKYFFVMNDNQEIGVYGIKDIDDERWGENTCEISICGFEEYKHKIPYRDCLRWGLYYPFLLGYDNILISTKVKAMFTLLNVCLKMGVHPLGVHNNKYWFYLQRGVS